MIKGLVDAVENLQSYDLAIEDAAKKRAACDARLRDLAEARAAREAAIAAAEAGRDENIRRTRGLERDLAVKEGEITRLEGRYLLLKTEKEIEKYESELARLRGEKGALEEAVLAAMDEAETLAADLDRLGREHRERSALDAVDGDAAREDAARLDGERARLAKLRGEFAAGLPPQALAEYEALAGKRKPAVARVERDTCQGCYLSISATILSDLRDRERLRKCSNCGRILFLPPR